MTLFLALTAFWSAVFFGGKYARTRWIRWRTLQPVRYVSEIKSARYYGQLSAKQFESLIMKSAKVRDFVIFDDPYLGRSKEQGYLWKKGKKYVIVQHTDGPLSEEHLQGIAKAVQRARAAQAFVFYPFADSIQHSIPEIQLFAGEKLPQWFAVLDQVRPPVPHSAPEDGCECGSPFRPQVNSAGTLLLVCSRFPVCRTIKPFEPAPNGKPPAIRTASVWRADPRVVHDM